MRYLYSAVTDAGTVREENEDCVMIQEFRTSIGPVVLAVLCDGMGGLAQGEVASAYVVQMFQTWAQTGIDRLCEAGIQDWQIRQEWEEIVSQCNASIREYGFVNGFRTGTTLVAFLLTPSRYYVLNVGDSRAYEITDRTVRQLTEDQSVVSRDVRRGLITEEQARTDTRRNILLQCIGVKEEVIGQFFFDTPEQDATYILCSDGFYHEITKQEMMTYLAPSQILDAAAMNERAKYLIEQNKYRGERDNMTVAVIKICHEQEIKDNVTGGNDY